MSRRRRPQETLSPEEQETIQRENDEFDQEMRALRETWVNAQRQRTPVFSGTQEVGTFAGLIGRPTGSGGVILPYYQTPSGIYFAYQYSMKTGKTNDITVRINLEGLRRLDYPRFYTAESFIEGKPIRSEDPKPGE